MGVPKVRLTKDLGVEAIGRGKAELAFVVASDRGVDYVLVGTVEGIGSAFLAAMRRTMRRWHRRYEAQMAVAPGGALYPEFVWIGLREIPESEFQRRVRQDGEWLSATHQTIPPTSPAIYLDDKEEIWSRFAIHHEDRPEPSGVRRVLGAFLERHGTTAKIEVKELEEHEGRGFTLSVDLNRPFPRGATVADVWRFRRRSTRIGRSR